MTNIIPIKRKKKDSRTTTPVFNKQESISMNVIKLREIINASQSKITEYKKIIDQSYKLLEKLNKGK